MNKTKDEGKAARWSHGAIEGLCLSDVRGSGVGFGQCAGSGNLWWSMLQQLPAIEGLISLLFRPDSAKDHAARSRDTQSEKGVSSQVTAQVM